MKSHWRTANQEKYKKKCQVREVYIMLDIWRILAYVYESYTLIIDHLVDHELEVKDCEKPLEDDKSGEIQKRSVR